MDLARNRPRPVRLKRYVALAAALWTICIAAVISWGLWTHYEAVGRLALRAGTYLVVGHLFLWLLGLLGAWVAARHIRGRIEEHARVERELRRQEELLQATVESTADGILVVDGEGRVLHSNRRFAEMWRIPEELVVRGQDEALQAHVLDQLVDPEAFLSRVRDLYHSTEEDFYTLHFKDGRVFERFSCPLHRDGDPGGRVWSFRDVTESHRGRQDLARARALLTEAIEQMPAGVLIADAPDVRIRLANSAALGIRGAAGAPLTDIPAELHPSRWQTSHPDGRPFEPEELPLSRAVLQGKTSRNVEAVIRRPDGERRTVLANAAPVRDAEGNVTAGVVVFPDITERKREEERQHKLEAQVRHAQKLESLGVLAGGIAHDFNNLLMAILGNADLAMSDLPEDSPVRETLREIVNAARRAADLTRQMLAYSGKGTIVTGALSLNEVVREMGQMLDVSIAKRATLRQELADALPTIEADATQIRQVVMNLLTNASEAIEDPGGEVVVRTTTVDCDADRLRGLLLAEDLDVGPYVCLEVSDTGCGMDPETIGRIFDPFFTTKFAGRGLGMAAVQGIVRGHGGAIEVRSRPGQGTTFRLFFPVAAGGDILAARPDRGESRDEWRGSGTVLLVDDEETVRAVGRAMLERAGFDVLEAEDGRQALERFREAADGIACVLLDLTMPRMDGERCLRELRAIRPDVRIVLTSGYTEQEVRSRLAGERPAGFLQKPYQRAQLIGVVRRALEKGPAAP